MKLDFRDLFPFRQLGKFAVDLFDLRDRRMLVDENLAKFGESPY